MSYGPPLRQIGQVLDIWQRSQAWPAPVIWRQLDGPRASPPPRPAFMFGGAMAQHGQALFSRIDLPPIGCLAVHDAAADPCGLLVKDGAAFYGDSLGVTEQQASATAARLNMGGMTSLQLASPLALLTCGDDFLIDALPLLWLLQSTGHALATLTFLVPPAISATARTILRSCGLDPSQILHPPNGTPIRAPRIIAPALMRTGTRFSPAAGEAIRFWTGRVHEALALPKTAERRPLFLSSPADADAIANWEAIEAKAASEEFEVVHTATLTFRDRVAKYGEASMLMGLDGTVLREACLFAPPGTAICALRGTRPPRLDLVGLATVLGHRVGYVFALQNQEEPLAPAPIDAGALALAFEALPLI